LLIDDGKFIGEVGSTGANECRDQRGFSREAAAGNHNGEAAPANHTGMDKSATDTSLSYVERHGGVEVLQKLLAVNGGEKLPPVAAKPIEGLLRGWGWSLEPIREVRLRGSGWLAA
jgi:hypothetical protein